VITGQVLIDEFISAHHLHRRKAVLVVDSIAAIIAVTGIVAFFITAEHWAIVLIEAGVSGLIGEFIQRRVYLPMKLRRLYSQIKDRTDVTYHWDDEKLVLTSKRGSAERSWGDFTKARENQDVILLYYNDALFEILSKRWFHERKHIDDFLRHLTLVRQF
jgi:hypothetical protein